jgi:hypothetical protein
VEASDGTPLSRSAGVSRRKSEVALDRPKLTLGLKRAPLKLEAFKSKIGLAAEPPPPVVDTVEVVASNVNPVPAVEVPSQFVLELILARSPA